MAVGRETQDVFDALDKQFGARWNGKDICVMERVLVRGPGYKGDDCMIITKDGEGLLARVKKVVSPRQWLYSKVFSRMGTR